MLISQFKFLMNSSGVLLIFGRFKGLIFMLKFCYTPWLLGDLDVPSEKFCWEKTICLFVHLCKNTGLDFLQIFFWTVLFRESIFHTFLPLVEYTNHMKWCFQLMLKYYLYQKQFFL